MYNIYINKEKNIIPAGYFVKKPIEQNIPEKRYSFLLNKIMPNNTNDVASISVIISVLCLIYNGFIISNIAAIMAIFSSNNSFAI